MKTNYLLPQTSVDEILIYKKQHQFQMACKLLFKKTHPEASDETEKKVGSHPNGYFEASLKHHEKPEKNEEIRK